MESAYIPSIFPLAFLLILGNVAYGIEFHMGSISNSSYLAYFFVCEDHKPLRMQEVSCQLAPMI